MTSSYSSGVDCAHVDAPEETEPGSLGIDVEGVDRTGKVDVDADLAREATRMKLFGQRNAERKVSRFVLLERVGSGGMGTVYAAHDPQLDRKVAVKLLGGSGGGATSAASDAGRMLTEARAMARISHPNVITVFEVGEHEEDGAEPVVFVAMEFVRGRTLRKWVLQERPTPAQIVAAYADAGQGLAAVHAAGLMHRDFKPDNVMISDDDGRVQVMDFGLARGGATIDGDATEASIDQAASSFVADLTRTGRVAGTPAYMAPEQLSGGELDHRADQFSFCVALYEALYGARPYPGTTPNEVAAAVLRADDPPEPPRGVVPRRVRAAIRRGLSPIPDERWPTMAQLVGQLAPRSRRRALWVGVAVGTAGIAWGAFESVTQAPPCQDGQAEFGDAWNAEAAARIDEAYAKVDADYARAGAAKVGATLDAYREHWISEHESACEATHVAGSQSEERLDRRMRCLERRRREVDAIIDVLAGVDAVGIQNTNDVLVALVDPARCDDDSYLGQEADPPATEQARAEAEEIRQAATKAGFLWSSGANAEGLELAQTTLERAESLDYLPARAEAELTCGTLEVLAGDMARGVELLERAYSSARGGGLPLVAAQAALERASLGGVKAGEGEAWLRVARAEIAANELEDLRERLLHTEATVLERAGDRRGAIEAELQRAELLEASCGRCQMLASAYQVVGYNHSQLGEHEDALRYTSMALEIADETVPVDHPFRATVLFRYGTALQSMRRYEDALGPLQESYDIKVRVLAPDNPNLASTGNSLGRVYVGLGRVEEGLALIETAVDVARAYGDPFFTASQLHNYAGTLEQHGDHTGAAAGVARGDRADGVEVPGGALGHCGFHGGLGIREGDDGGARRGDGALPAGASAVSGARRPGLAPDGGAARDARRVVGEGGAR